MSLKITDENFNEVLNSNECTVVDFSAAWCGPCKALAPIVDELSGEYDGRVAVGKIDIEESPEATENYGIRSVPTILFFKNGELVKDMKVVGMSNKKALVEKFDALLEK